MPSVGTLASVSPLLTTAPAVACPRLPRATLALAGLGRVGCGVAGAKDCSGSGRHARRTVAAGAATYRWSRGAASAHEKKSLHFVPVMHHLDTYIFWRECYRTDEHFQVDHNAYDSCIQRTYDMVFRKLQLRLFNTYL